METEQFIAPCAKHCQYVLVTLRCLTRKRMSPPSMKSVVSIPTYLSRSLFSCVFIKA
jgi:hypothetical protein